MSAADKKQLTVSDVQHIAKLAHLKLTETELQTFVKQFSSILEFVQALNAIDTTTITPTNQVTGLENVFRDDVVEPSLTQEEALANAPVSENGYFVVKAVLED